MEHGPLSGVRRRRRPPRALVVLAIGALAVTSLLTACSLDWVVIPKEAGPDDGGAESKASLDDAAKLAS